MIRNWAKVGRPCENKIIHADDIRGNNKEESLIVFFKIDHQLQKFSQICHPKHHRIGNAQQIMNNCKTAPFAKMSTGQGFLQMRQFINRPKSGIKHMSCLISYARSESEI